VVLFCRFKRHPKTLWWLTGAGVTHNLYTQKKCPPQDSDFIRKFDRRKDTHFLDKLKLATQALEIESEGWLRRIIENPCVGGSIPPRATKKHRYVPDTCFTSGTDHMVYTFTNHIPNTLGPNGFSRACTREDSISK
jgi:hypothetical protein